MAAAAGGPPRERSRSREGPRAQALAHLAAARAAALAAAAPAEHLEAAAAGLQGLSSQQEALQQQALLQAVAGQPADALLQQLAALQQLGGGGLQQLEALQPLDGGGLQPLVLQAAAQLDPLQQLLASQPAGSVLQQLLAAQQQGAPLLEQPSEAVAQASDHQSVLQQIALQQLILKQAEDEVKAAAAKAGGYVGILARFDDVKGYGFIECSESRQQYGRDVFCLKSKKNDAEVGDMVTFTVELGDQGKPQAATITRLAELSQHKRMILTWQQMYTGAIVDASAGVPVIGSVKEFTGSVGKYDSEKGFGFIECAETYSLYQRNVFVHKDHWVPGIQVGDTVGFQVELNNKGWPQARNISKKEVRPVVVRPVVVPATRPGLPAGAALSGTAVGTLVGAIAPLPAQASFRLGAPGSAQAPPPPPPPPPAPVAILAGTHSAPVLATAPAAGLAAALPAAGLAAPPPPPPPRAQEGVLSLMIAQDPLLSADDAASLRAFFARLRVTSVREIQELGKVTSLQELVGKELYNHELATPMSMPAKTALGRILLKATGAG